MEPNGVDGIGQNSGQFRSRVNTSVSQRRLNVSISQTRESANVSTKPDSSNEKEVVHETCSNYELSLVFSVMSSLKRHKWLFHLFVVACTISFTYDIMYSKGNIFESKPTEKGELLVWERG